MATAATNPMTLAPSRVETTPPTPTQRPIAPRSGGSPPPMPSRPRAMR
ncbi:hypothetical protein Y88_0990 [Novosphingobium nitrogenifigens DSM 19370]|uniref:Uncharacterized protein n=1 Tax=Novosphingobium nitrogenifigens DSM 19370 TaxID=983920 RepID=F1Z952_9SPHN|nr:hypothetical protein Y88_0990 [Novosphingobium nitrogenifigens DSM 19370]